MSILQTILTTERKDLKTPLEKVVYFAIEGLYVDGAHHKQWYLERILEASGVDLNELKRIVTLEENALEWEKGIAP